MKMDKNYCSCIKKWGVILLLTIPFSLVSFPFEGHCDQNARIIVKTILASRDEGSIDPKLKDLAQELNSVFRYSSYKFLGQRNMTLSENKSGSVDLPEGRKMNITSGGVSGDRVTLRIEIFKGNSRIFQTVIQLRNNASVTIGGPGYKGGNLLFNIFTSF